MKNNFKPEILPFPAMMSLLVYNDVGPLAKKGWPGLLYLILNVGVEDWPRKIRPEAYFSKGNIRISR